MEPQKRQRNNNACSPPPPLLASPTLHADLLLEIAARTDVGTILRCAAACKTLRDGILTPIFIEQQAAAVIPSRLVAHLHTARFKRRHQPREPLDVSLVHPPTPVAYSLVGNHLAPFVSRRAADLLRLYGG